MPPKEDNKAKDGTVTVNIDEFTRSRDSVLVSLTQLSSAVADLSRAYINHSNTVLGRKPEDFDLGIINSGITNALYQNGLLTRPSSPGAKSEAGGDKKKRKRNHDPNAPKRALTPYFLYMQHNRPQIQKELGDDNVKPKDVAEEGTRRWGSMTDVEKAVWKKIYLENLEKYRQQMGEYKAQKEQKAHEHDQAASSQLQQEATAEPSQAGSDDEEENEEEEDEEEASPESEVEASPTPEPRKEPSPPRSSKQRRRSDVAKTSKAVEESPVAPKSPEKKKRTSARKEKEQETPAPASTRKTTETKRPRKKRKSDAGDE
ncbi:uncharacterized protein ASPGLDRAFT_166831 [Aspergillus glaucus CBS 516.65]|uniref:HMG box domain-containing protein n=1 Tax=Aspergillus glaucus CBS 516.65 TaxID=1160497 RepID=A0A1L9VRK9_ASPGL|nr:hypothetical protein ASPGLDRAFT_166831 [Aspergillus glaucus CBS 516.65]OJJ86537.1 hypothetical protein ASPGLDRAFT_166831 [Aspergillus glaucus CBS 516.65]